MLNKLLKKGIKGLSYLYYMNNKKKRNFIPAAGKVFDHKEIFSGIEATLDCHWTEGRFSKEFCKEFSKVLGVKHTLLCNSGSSANLLAISALKSPLLKERSLQDGDEVITVAAGFPTTVNAIVQNNLVPVFVDIDIPTYNIKVEQLEKALSEKTKAIFVAHTLGNPFNADVFNFCRKHGLWIISDCCDALGSRYKIGNMESNPAFLSDISTFSFYPAHHITGGEMGAVCTNSTLLKRIIMSYRDWGRECICDTGMDNLCGNRFTQKHGELPSGFDHKYVYSHMGYNLKTTDWSAAIALEQLKKLETFKDIREDNYIDLWLMLNGFRKYFILPEKTRDTKPCWFGFPITIKEDAPFNRNDIVRFLEENGVGTRLLFAGNILKQPAYKNFKRYRIADENNFKNTDIVLNRTFWVGIWHGLGINDMVKIYKTFEKFIIRIEGVGK